MTAGAIQVFGHDLIQQKLARIFEQGRVPGTLIFSGYPSVGKFKVALSQAQRLFCPNACGHCGHCVRVSKEQHERLRIVKSEGNQPIKVDDIRSVIKFLSLQSERGEAKAVIVDGAEKLNSQAANAFLKTLEEPPENCHIFLVTSSLYRLLPTIRSRGQIFRFGSLSDQDIQNILPGVDIGSVSGRVDLVSKYTDPAYKEFASEMTTKLLSLHRLRLSELISSLQPEIKDKQKCSELILFLQQVLAAAFKLSIGEESVFSSEVQPLLDHLCQNMDTSVLMALFQETVVMKRSHASNFDMSLALESLFLKWIDATSTEA